MPVKANKDPGIQIKEVDLDSYHVEFMRITPDQSGKHPTRTPYLQIYSQRDYENFIRNLKDNMVAASFDEIRVVHDPVLYKKQEAQKEALARAREEKKKKAETKEPAKV